MIYRSVTYRDSVGTPAACKLSCMGRYAAPSAAIAATVVSFVATVVAVIPLFKPNQIMGYKHVNYSKVRSIAVDVLGWS